MYLVFIGEVSNTVSVKELFKYCICDQEIKGGTHIGAAFDPLDPGAWATEISILGIPAELLKSCICDPEIGGVGLYCNAKGQKLEWGSVQSSSNPVSLRSSYCLALIT